MAKGILIASMNMANAAEDEFRDWYDTEHMPERVACPGFLRCQRWIGTTDRKISVATYDLETVDVLKSPGYLAIGGVNLSPWSKRLGSRYERLMRFEGEQVLPGDQIAPEGAAGFLLNAMNCAPEAEAEFNEWYNKEHLPQLGAVPGVLTARRFQAAGAGVEKKYLALYHLASMDVPRSGAWSKAANTPWTEKMRPHFRDALVLRCKKYIRKG
jgi:hypothetical protein